MCSMLLAGASGTLLHDGRLPYHKEAALCWSRHATARWYVLHVQVHAAAQGAIAIHA